MVSKKTRVAAAAERVPLPLALPPKYKTLFRAKRKTKPKPALAHDNSFSSFLIRSSLGKVKLCEDV